MDWIDGPGYWRILREDGIVGAERVDAEEGRRLIAEGAKDITRVENDKSGGLLGFQNSGGVLQLPGGQAVPNGVFTALWNCQ